MCIAFGDDTQKRRDYHWVITGRCFLVWDLKRGKELHAPNVSLSGIPDTAPFTFAQGRWVEWLRQVIDRHFHHSTLIGRNSNGKRRSCSKRRFVHFSAYAFQCTVGLRDRSDEIEESHYMNNEGRCPLACPNNLQMY